MRRSCGLCGPTNCPQNKGILVRLSAVWRSRVDRMELLGERPVWSMSGSELLSTLDALDAEAARRETYRLAVIAAIENTGYAAELGARDTAELIRVRYRLDELRGVP